MWQFARFVLAGGVLTMLSLLTYAVPAIYLGIDPLLSYLFSHLVAVVAGYAIHSRLTFGGDEGRGQHAVRALRFFAVSLVSLTLNSLFVWLLTGPMGASPWWPLLPMAFVTPVVTFLLNRQWVFGAFGAYRAGP